MSTAGIVGTVLGVSAGIAFGIVSLPGPHYAFCRAGYARDHRPSYAYTHAVKLEFLDGRPARDFELDHVVPLELGGDPYAWSNLQLQRWSEARLKDQDENALHDAVCSGRMDLVEAQRRMREWRP